MTFLDTRPDAYPGHFPYKAYNDYFILGYFVLENGKWDKTKYEENHKKHGISFDEAKSVFFDEKAIEFYDDEHSEWEDRFLLLGLSKDLKLLMVCHCFRESESVIRIFSARKATKKESNHYTGEL